MCVHIHTFMIPNLFWEIQYSEAQALQLKFRFSNCYAWKLGIYTLSPLNLYHQENNRAAGMIQAGECLPCMHHQDLGSWGTCKKWDMVAHAYNPSNVKVEGRSLCSTWETRLLWSGKRNRLWHRPPGWHITMLIKHCVLPQFSHLRQNLSLFLPSFHYVSQFRRGWALRGKAHEMGVSPRKEMETLTNSLESNPVTQGMAPGLVHNPFWWLELLESALPVTISHLFSGIHL